MLIHIRQKALTNRHTRRIEIVDLKINEFGIHLHADKDIALRCPYEDRLYKIVTHAGANRSYDGILIESNHPIAQFTCTTSWIIDKEKKVILNTTYTIIDNEYDAVTDNMELWSISTENIKNWKIKNKAYADGRSPLELEPRLNIRNLNKPNDRVHIPDSKKIKINDKEYHVVNKRFDIPTIPKENLLNQHESYRIPNMRYLISARNNEND